MKRIVGAHRMQERFEQKMPADRPPYECWEWQGGIHPDGHGYFFISGLGQRGAHRAAYMLFVGPIPPGRQIHHVCDNRSCVNPEHLVAVTPWQHTNISGRGGQTHCIHGHEFTEENTGLIKGRDGRLRRQCRACGRERVARYQERLRAAA